LEAWAVERLVEEEYHHHVLNQARSDVLSFHRGVPSFGTCTYMSETNRGDSQLKSRLRTKAWVGRVDWREGPTSRYLLPPFKSINKLHAAATSTQLFRNLLGDFP
jgi:hypothetical protein